jgi:inner membrane protein
MASVFAHAFAAAATATCVPERRKLLRMGLLGMLCAILPDVDVLAFRLGIPYEHMLGHRGITHSLTFAAAWGLLMAWLFYPREDTPDSSWWMWALYFGLCTASHGLLDAITNGGRGVAFFAPFDGTRYFFPWRPVQVSPIGTARFFSEWGVRVLLSEVRYIGLPFGLLMALGLGIRQIRRRH